MADLNTYQRKLLYFKGFEPPGDDYRFRTVVKLMGNELGVDATFHPTADPGAADSVRTYGPIADDIKPFTWYTIEVQQTTESAFGSGNGILRVWLDRVLIFEKLNMRWTNPAWTKQPPENFYWSDFLVGQQVNDVSMYDEYRYWDNITFSTTRLP